VALTPLRRNRDFLLLQSGQLLSAMGSEATAIAYPLLALAVTHSPARAGVVSFARLVPFALLQLPAGVAADRMDRRRMMVAADLVRATAIGALAAMIAAGDASFALLAVVAFVEGAGTVVFTTAATGALRSVVPAPQLPDAVGAVTARIATVNLAGPPLGGYLFGVARSLPFVVDACSYAASLTSLALVRTPFQGVRAPSDAGVRAQVAEGMRFLWDRPFLRTCAFLYGLGNFSLPGILLVIVVAGRAQGLTGGEIGALLAVFGTCLLAGSLLSPLARRGLSMRTILWIELVAWMGSAAFLVWPSVYVLAAGVLPQGLAMPITDSAVVGYRIAVTPDRLLGRVEAVRSSIALAIAPLGPLAAGLLLEAASARETIAVFCAFNVVLLVWGFASPSIRSAPSLSDLAAVEPA
jgi:Major Facilitator Superfamily